MKRLTPIVTALVLLTWCVGSAQAAFGVKEFTVSFLNAGGSAVEQAGAHPYSMVTVVKLDTAPPHEELRNLDVSLPVGFVGNATAQQACTPVQFKTVDTTPGEESGTSCPQSSVVGVVGSHILNSQDASAVAAVYNLQPPPGAAAAIGFRVAAVPVAIEFHVDPARPNNLLANVSNLQQANVTATYLEIWGDPSDSSHDPYRGHCLNLNSALELGEFSSLGNCPTSQTPPFLTTPRTCQENGIVSYTVTSWSGTVDSGSTEIPKMKGCERLGLSPQITASPSSRAASSPSGLDFGLSVEDPGLTSSRALAGSDIKDVSVTMPEGFVANPSVAEGLAACTEADLARETATSPSGSGCPEAAKIGTVEVETPLLGQTLPGTIYTAEPYRNQAGNSLLGVYVVIKDPELGVLIQQPVEIDPDPVTGRLVATSTSLPQLPFSHFKLHFRSGERGPLTTPSTCGSYRADAEMTPWSGGPQVSTDSTFEIVTGPAGGPCGPQAFSPGFEAGSVTPLAGTYSPFVLKLSRPAGSAQLRSIGATLPPGLLAKLKGVEECPDAAIAAAEGRDLPDQGALELASPSCPAASEVGSVTVGAGSGAPTFVDGRAYLAGPYKGAPLSLVVVTPAVTGPFDLGAVVVRNALHVDPITAQVRAVSDPLPSILQGIPLDIRSVSVDLSRPDFTLNPTSCDPTAIQASIGSSSGGLAPLSSRFQVGGCKGLSFAPKLKLSLLGKTSRAATPRLKAVLTTRPGEANIKRALVNLPHSEFLEQNHIGTVCTRVQFAEGNGNGSACPKGSVYGHAKAWSPLLEKPLSGPVYLRSSSHKLPDLVAALNGQISIALDGKIDSGRNGGIRSTFEVVPDAPVSRFVLEMAGGSKGLLVNSENLCSPRAKRHAIVRLLGQNGKQEDAKPLVANSCGSKKRHGK